MEKAAAENERAIGLRHQVLSSYLSPYALPTPFLPITLRSPYPISSTGVPYAATRPPSIDAAVGWYGCGGTEVAHGGGRRGGGRRRCEGSPTALLSSGPTNPRP
eukprot:3941130-Rhodomonas_salina.1